MCGIYIFRFEDNNIIVNYDSYTISLPEYFWDKIQQDDEFKFLYKCLICKHSLYYGFFDDETKRTVFVRGKMILHTVLSNMPEGKHEGFKEQDFGWAEK